MKCVKKAKLTEFGKLVNISPFSVGMALMNMAAHQSPHDCFETVTVAYSTLQSVASGPAESVPVYTAAGLVATTVEEGVPKSLEASAVSAYQVLNVVGAV